MRKYKRSIARAIMEKNGIKQINKMKRGNPSFFATYWKEYFKKCRSKSTKKKTA